MIGIVASDVPRHLRGIFFWACLLPFVAAATPYRPADPNATLERLPRPLPLEPRAATDDPLIIASQAQRGLELARRSGDARHLARAQHLIQNWWHASSPPDAILFLRASIHEAWHRYQLSLADLDVLVQGPSAEPEVWLMRSRVQRSLGRYAEAAQSCDRMADRVDPVVLRICQLAVASHRGQLTSALAELDSMRRAVLYQPRPVIAWFYRERTDAQVRAGKPAAARRSYEYALSRFPEDVQLRTGFADLLLHQNAYVEVLDLIPADSRHDALLLRRALALAATHDPRFVSLDRQLRDHYRKSRLRGDLIHLRDEVHYGLSLGHDARRLTPLAQLNWQNSREPWDARLLIDCANRIGHSRVGRPVQQWLRQTRLEDVRIPPLARP